MPYFGYVEPVPLFPLWIARNEGGISGVWFEEPPGTERGEGDPLLEEAIRQFRAYFARTLRAFDLPLALEGTEFQRRVWEAVLRIPYGETRSYGEIARLAGAPGGARAAGAANGANPIPIVVPCHRVIAAGGRLQGYGGGLERKKFLLELESGASASLISESA
jgi:methylated-DNA-[protein]-cysteine S-methyltransferase